MNFTVFLILLFTIGTAIGFTEVFLNNKRKETGQIKYKWIFPVVLIFYILMLTSTFVEYFVIQRKINIFVVSLGLSLIIIRFLLKYWSVKNLGKFWSPNIEIREKHELIKAGPYKYLRHPAYLTSILDILIAPIIANAYFTFVWTFIGYLTLTLIRIHLEEKALTEKFGEEYIEYQKETSAILPLPKFLLIKWSLFQINSNKLFHGGRK